MQYSLGKGAVKGLISLLSIIGAGLAFTAFSDITLVSLIERYLFPILGSLTVGGVLTTLVNYLKLKFTGKIK